MTKRLEILKNSLEKKQVNLDAAYDSYFADVKRAHGQPLNDKRNGQATLNRWERGRDKIRNIRAEIEKTKNAIEFEEGIIFETSSMMNRMPQQIIDLVDLGILKQWRKHPNTFFVDGVDKARIQYKDGRLLHKFTRTIKCKEQHAIFRDTYNQLYKSLKEATE